MSPDIVAFVCFILGLISGAVGVTLSGRSSTEMARDTTHRLPPPPRPAPPMPAVKAPKDASIYDCFDTGAKLVTALADRFGIPSEQLLNGSHLETGTDQNGKPSDVLQTVFVVALSPDDVVEAGRTLDGKADQNAE